SALNYTLSLHDALPISTSTDGIRFKATAKPVGRGSAYWRLFRYDGWWYALAMPGRLYRSRDGLTPFERGPQLFPSAPTQVHNARSEEHTSELQSLAYLV